MGAPESLDLHPVLVRILRKEQLTFDDGAESGEACLAVLRRVSAVLRQADEDRYTHERSLEVVSEEMRDLNDDLRASSESELARERDLLQAVMDSIGDGLSVLDAQGRVTFANAEAERLLAAKPGALIGSIGWDFVANRVESFSMASLARGEPCRGEDARVRRVDGSSFEAGYAITPVVRDGAIVAIVNVFRDITLRKRAESELRRARDHALEIARLKSEFVANISHELRTPLNGVIGMADLLAATSLDATQRRYTQTVQVCSETLLSLINNILDFSALEAGKIALREEAFDPRSAVAAALRIVEPAAHDNSVRLAADVDPGVPAAVEADGSRISQVLLNLLANAVKFTSGGAVRVRVTADTGGADALLRFQVEDTGVGLAEEHQDLVFEPFRQVDGSTTRAHGGSGLGLSICRRLVELLGGRIGVESALGRGSTFWFTVPVRVLREPRRPELAPALATTRDLRGARVLVAEDNDINRELVLEILTLAGAEVSVATDGREAVGLCLEKTFDVVLMDCLMPSLDGFSAARTIRERIGPHPPIVAFTAAGEADSRQRCIDAGMDDFVAKPVLVEDVLAVVRKWAGRPG